MDEMIKSETATEREVEMFVNKGDAEKRAEMIKKADKMAPYQKKLLGWLGKVKKKSELGRPKAFYRRTDFGKEIYKSILSKN